MSSPDRVRGTFVDGSGARWEVPITVATVRAVRSRLGIDLAASFWEVMQRFETDVVTLCDVLYVVCASCPRNPTIDDQAFGRALFGDALGDGLRALAESLSDFSPNPRVRKLIEETISAARMANEKRLTQVEAAITPEWLASILSDAPTTAPASSESTQTPTL